MKKGQNLKRNQLKQNKIKWKMKQRNRVNSLQTEIGVCVSFVANISPEI